MSNIYNSVSELVGRTPLLELRGIEAARGLNVRLLAKLECRNPAGSAKDRIARAMLDDAEARGLIAPGAVIIEPTSGNTGIALAALGTARGYTVVLTMPDTMSVERRKLLAAYGARLVLTPGAKGMGGAIEEAERIAAETPGSFIPGQFTNPANPRAHYLTTGPEIWEDTDGGVDAFVCGVGSGGSITGVGRFLKERKPGVQVVAVEPADSPILSGGKPGPHKIQGIGAAFVPEVLDTKIYDRVATATTEEAFAAARLAAAKDGVLIGISSGASLSVALKLSAEPEYAGKTIVVLFTDSGERYLSSGLFD